jgi:hypothetical protein
MIENRRPYLAANANAFAHAPRAKLEWLALVATRAAVICVKEKVGIRRAVIRVTAALPVEADTTGSASISARAAVDSVCCKIRASCSAQRLAGRARTARLADAVRCRSAADATARSAVVRVGFEIGATTAATSLAPGSAIVAARPAVRVGRKVGTGITSARSTESTGIVAARPAGGKALGLLLRIAAFAERHARIDNGWLLRFGS